MSKVQILDRDPLAVYYSEDNRLAVGVKVTAFWSSWGHYFRARAKVIKLDARSVTVALQEPVEQFREYPVGSRIRVPRFVDNIEWTTQNCVRLRKTLVLP